MTVSNSPNDWRNNLDCPSKFDTVVTERFKIRSIHIPNKLLGSRGNQRRIVGYSALVALGNEACNGRAFRGMAGVDCAKKHGPHAALRFAHLARQGRLAKSDFAMHLPPPPPPLQVVLPATASGQIACTLTARCLRLNPRLLCPPAWIERPSFAKWATHQRRGLALSCALGP